MDLTVLAGPPGDHLAAVMAFEGFTWLYGTPVVFCTLMPVYEDANSPCWAPT